jgi:thiamine-phosphate pyrophosphorylase
VSLPSPPLLLVTDRSQARLPLMDIVSEACAAGCRWISLREKDLSEDEQIAIFGGLRRAVQKWQVRATIHGSARAVKAAGADGVHLMAGRDPVAARAQLGSGALIGLSIHHQREIEKLPRDVLDYVIAGPTYETESKPGYGPALGAAGIAAMAAMAASDNIPVIAIGGITPGRVSDVIAAGATGIAVMGAVMRSAAPGREIARLLDALAGCKVEQNQ